VIRLERSEHAAVVVLAILAAATAYEALIALEVIGLGAKPGDGAPWEAFIRLTALVAMLIGAALIVADPISRLGMFVPLGAAAFMLARFYTFDPYYLSTLRRFSDDGLVPPALVFLVLVLALVAAMLIRAKPRAGGLLGVMAVLACAFLAIVMAGGH
jgi:hypothetical protein